MPKASPSQRKTAGGIMRVFEHGELEAGRGGRSGKVNSRKQASAMALSR